ncbi:MAG TPA: hypothetical protein VH741_08820 [Candidatus Limnocylindrales bacterium]
MPGPSFVAEEEVSVRAGGRRLRAGLTTPSVMDDGWWLTHLWLADEAGVVEAIELAPAAGPAPGTPLDALGPRIAGALAGLIAQEEGRQLLRLRMPPAADEARPWQRPAVCMLAIKFDSLRAAVMSREQLARELLVAFAAAAEGIGRPG